MSLRTIGIDLGTTNSCVATIDDAGRPRIIDNKQGEGTTPSMVSFLVDKEENRRRHIGAPAKRMAVTNPDGTVFGVKRLLGRRYDDPEVQALARTLPYKVEPAPNGDAWVRLAGELLSPPELSALVLAELKAVAEEHFGSEVGEAIITVPAHFDNAQRRATQDAAAIAGLEVRRLLNEPTAAALGYGAHRGEDRRLAICDLGGGTFDVSIVNVESGVIEVISTHGDLFLGGDDVDRFMIERIVEEVKTSHGIDLFDDATALQRLKSECQSAKHLLSESTVSRMDLRYLAELPGKKPLNLVRTMQRRELESWVKPWVDRLEPACLEAAARCGLAPRDVDEIILVGGMTRMPIVQKRIGEIFGKPPLKVVNPDEIVSIGAATQCAILDGRIEGVVLLDVTSRALGLDSGEGRCQIVIPRNATIPTREHKILATTSDGQRSIAIDVYEGESAEIAHNRHLGRFVCGELPDAPAGEVLLLVEFTVDVDGILRVSATEMSSGARPELRLVATAGLTRADVHRLSSELRAGG
jgi:molecular chaperone DnaK